MPADRTYKNEAQQNLVRMVEYLAEDILQAKTQKELAEALGISKDQAFRTLWNLKDRGWAEESANGFRLSPRLTMIADKLRRAVADTLDAYLGKADMWATKKIDVGVIESHVNVSKAVSDRVAELGLKEE